MLLSEKHVVVTGAGGALGRAVVAVARAQGAQVTLVDAIEVPGERALKLDLTDAGATAKALAALPAIDAVFHVAGGFTMGSPSYDIPADEWSGMFAINVTTLRNVVAAVIPGMVARGSGKLVTIGAHSALRGQAQMAAYCAAKASVMRLTESLSAELKVKGINVNGVLPTLIDTPKNRADMSDADFSTWVNPEDLAHVICFLGSDSARAVHGALVPVAGLL